MALSKIGTDGISADTAINGFTPTASNMAGRNRIINGDMRIDQRNAGAAISTSSGALGYPVDRWYMQNNVGTFSSQQVADAPPGFVNSLKVTVSSSGTPGSTDYARLAQRIEGFNVADLNYGSANAKSISVSFWVKSSVTGTYGFTVNTAYATTVVYVTEYTISAANTWTKVTATIPPETIAAINTNNELGLLLGFDMGEGSSRSQAAGVWTVIVAGTYGLTGGTKLVTNASATWQITGVQLEEGSVATPFEYRMYGQELALCQRYYNYATNMWMSGQSYGTNGSVDGFVQVFRFPTEMRANPTITFSGGSDGGSSASLYSGGVSTSHVNINLRSQAANTYVWYAGFKTTAEAEL